MVVNGFGPDCDWVRNIEGKGGEAVTVGSEHFLASHRFLGQEEAARVIRDYEHGNRVIAPLVRAGFTWLLGWQHHGSEDDRQRLVKQLPLIAFRPSEVRITGEFRPITDHMILPSNEPGKHASCIKADVLTEL